LVLKKFLVLFSKKNRFRPGPVDAQLLGKA